MENIIWLLKRQDFFKCIILCFMFIFQFHYQDEINSIFYLYWNVIFLMNLSKNFYPCSLICFNFFFDLYEIFIMLLFLRYWYHNFITGDIFAPNLCTILSMIMFCRYRNYKTFTSPKPDQFSSLAVDSAGEIICAGGTNEFQIYVWTLKTGRLLQVWL